MTQAVLLPRVETFQAKLVEAHDVTPRVREFVFERLDGAPFTFKSGQWVSLVLPLLDARDRPLRRSYSLASVPGDSSRFELLITRVDDGAASAWLHQAPPGTVLDVKGPQGTFARDLDAGPSLFVATGTGVAPFRGFVHDALKAGRTEPLWVLFGVRTVDDALYLREFEALQQQHAYVRFIPTLSRANDAWAGRTGYVQKHVLELWNELSLHGTPHVYICGVKKMLTEVRELLKTHAGLERHQLHLESYD
ncbi:MAG: oxidoreductase [Archangium gephyra]|uniref:Oxidoreductase n=1 Tax=Archangium gephyra TaxID=48 RepID=A0A2W5V1Z4_9BACT|nr:MAG: oxidoreductase [Archangium gephyra]